MEKLTVVLLEAIDNQVEVQLFAEPEKARDSFRNLTRVPGRVRATFLSLRFDGDSVQVDSETRQLPHIEEPIDGWRIGEGPFNAGPVTGCQGGTNGDD